jgi:hypothetical protein
MGLHCPSPTFTLCYIAELSQSGCTQKLCYNKTFFGQVKKLGEILTEKYGHAALLVIIDNLDI